MDYSDKAVEYGVKAVEFVKHYIGNFLHNVTHMFDGMDYIRYGRLLAIVAAYFLLRPYLEKYAAKMQEKQFDKIDQETKDAEATAAISPNAMRGGKVAAASIQAEATTGADLSKSAKKRQGQAVRRAEAKAKQEEEDDSWSDPDVSDLLT